MHKWHLPRYAGVLFSLILLYSTSSGCISSPDREVRSPEMRAAILMEYMVALYADFDADKFGSLLADDMVPPKNEYLSALQGVHPQFNRNAFSYTITNVSSHGMLLVIDVATKTAQKEKKATLTFSRQSGQWLLIRIEGEHFFS